MFHELLNTKKSMPAIIHWIDTATSSEDSTHDKIYISANIELDY